ncbi:MAG: hypothetical protein AABY07_01360 [Nanoarchaeota archaeon]
MKKIAYLVQPNTVEALRGQWPAEDTVIMMLPNQGRQLWHEEEVDWNSIIRIAKEVASPAKLEIGFWPFSEERSWSSPFDCMIWTAPEELFLIFKKQFDRLCEACFENNIKRIWQDAEIYHATAGGNGGKMAQWAYPKVELTSQRAEEYRLILQDYELIHDFYVWTKGLPKGFWNWHGTIYTPETKLYGGDTFWDNHGANKIKDVAKKHNLEGWGGILIRPTKKWKNERLLENMVRCSMGLEGLWIYCEPDSILIEHWEDFIAMRKKFLKIK